MVQLGVEPKDGTLFSLVSGAKSGHNIGGELLNLIGEKNLIVAADPTTGEAMRGVDLCFWAIKENNMAFFEIIMSNS